MNTIDFIFIGALIAVVVWLHGRLKSVESEVKRIKDETMLERLRAMKAESNEKEAVMADQRPVASPVVKPSAPVIAISDAPPPLPMAKPVDMPRKAAVTESAAKRFDWEQFLGIKLLAWLCGLALFFAAVFFVKYSFERGLVPPWMRVASGFALGAGLIAAGWRMRGGRYDATAQTLTATGVVILYAVTFACRAFYRFEWAGVPQVFGVMAAVTAGAFLLAIRMDARVVAVLGMLGGFLTPPLLSTGEDNPGGLFTYIAVLDAGLLAVVWHKRWNFLAPLAAVGTALMQTGWMFKFFGPEKLWIAQIVLLGFPALFAGFWHARPRRDRDESMLITPVIGLAMVALGEVFALLSVPALRESAVGIFGVSLIADALVLSMVARDVRLRRVEAIAGTLVFIQLTVWTLATTRPPLTIALGLYFVFGLLHSAFPMIVQKIDPESRPTLWSRLSPAIALLLMLVPLIGGGTMPWAFWPVVILCNGLAILVAAVSGSILSVLAGFAITLAVAFAWIVRGTSGGDDLAENLFVISGFATFFFGTGLLLFRISRLRDGGSDFLARFGLPSDVRVQIPALGGTMPFLLLGVLAVKARLPDPSALFGAALFLAILLLGLTFWTGARLLVPVALAGVLSVQGLWTVSAPGVGAQMVALSWHAGFCALFFLWPFLRLKPESSYRIPWATSALAMLAHWPLILNSLKILRPELSAGLVTLCFAPPLFAGMEMLRRSLPAEHPKRAHHLAWFGGMGLLFVTAALAREFSRQWLTIAWALEGFALVALSLRVPHPGLRRTGVALLVIVFARLALNPFVLEYERSGTPVWNWYLAAYGTATVGLFAAGRLLGPFRERFLGRDIRAVLYSLGTVLAFLLVNIEIADFFGEGTRLRFTSGTGVAQSLAYTIAWALFAFILVSVGLFRGISAARWSGLVLLGATLVKLFFNDLARLDQLYRIGAFASVAVIGIAMSLLYQRLARREQAEKVLEKTPHQIV